MKIYSESQMDLSLENYDDLLCLKWLQVILKIKKATTPKLHKENKLDP
jgi:hypothetical protein